MLTFREKLLVAFKWLASFCRRDWRLDDYPIRTRRNGEGVPLGQEWLALILHWPGPCGLGPSKEKAIQDLDKCLENIRAHRIANGEKMPRPGTHVPIQFAPIDRVDANPALCDDFITRVLGFKSDAPVFISDRSSLGDFGDDTHVTTLQQKIKDVYGVDVTDMKEGLICEILERIQQKG